MTLPNYEYQCTECQHLFEIWQPVGEAAPNCPECGSAVKKIFHAPRVIFKGSGFYVTDLRAEKEKSSGSSAKPAAESSTETKSEPAKSESSSSGEAAAPTPPATNNSAPSSTKPTP
jgi:putative FmdB family regulatory protein